MPNIKDETLNRVKSEIDLAELVRQSGIELKPQGKNLIGHCPFHDDTDPSLVVTPSKNLWHCLGACSMGGGVIDWTMKSRNVEFKEAVNILAGQLNGKPVHKLIAESKTGSNQEFPSKPESPQIPSDQKLLKRVVAYYHDRLKETPEALATLQSRGLVHPDLIEKFQIGYCDRSLAAILPSARTEDGKAIRERLKNTGLYKGKGHELFNGCLTFPVTDLDGNILELYGRRIKNDKRLANHLYMPGPHKGVFNLEAFQGRELIFCESIIDALSFWVNGFENVTAIYGTEGFTDDHRKLIRSQGIQRAIFAFDSDKAGNGAALRIGKEIFEMGLECFKINLPRGLDINEVILLQKDVKQRPHDLKQLLKQVERLPFKRVPGSEAETKTAKEEGVRLASALPSLAAKTSPDGASMVKASENDSGSVKQKSEENVPKDGVLTVQREEIFTRFGPREYRIRGFFKNLSLEVLRINLRITFDEETFVHQVDLYNAKSRKEYIAEAAKDLGLDVSVIKSDLGKILYALEELQNQEIEKRLNPEPKKVILSAREEMEALEFLKSKNLMDRIAIDFETCGLIGKRENALLGYLAMVSRKMEKPLAIIVQSSSAAGKSTLMDAVLRFMPEEDVQRYTAMTGQSLFYMGENNLVHKILAISEEEGAEQASYALKTLQSEGSLSIASTGKNPKTGRLETMEYLVKGPVTIIMTTTNPNLDEELANRCFILIVDESRLQTKAIHQWQREAATIEGLIQKRQGKGIIPLHQNAGRLLKPIDILNPYAALMSFPDQYLRTRRDHDKYLNLIYAITFLHQYQRPHKVDPRIGKDPFIEVDLADIEWANRLSRHVLSRSMDDLQPQTRRFLQTVTQMVGETAQKNGIEPHEVRFTRRELRHFCGLGDNRVHTHLQRLVRYEYLSQSQVSQSNRYVYELLYASEPETESSVFSGLVDTDLLRKRFESLELEKAKA